MKKRFILLCGLIVAAAVATRARNFPSDPFIPLTEGNLRFIKGDIEHQPMDRYYRAELAKGQHPFAAILTCSDSRVPPEHIFNQGLGDLFVVRVAGNVVDPVALGSLEYAAEHLGVALIVIMGHTGCGAVQSALESKGADEGNIGVILGKIAPAVRKARALAALDSKADLLDLAVRANVDQTAAEILRASPVLSRLAGQLKVRIVKTLYHLDTGAVEILR
jgi:carbonic anhydrase